MLHFHLGCSEDCVRANAFVISIWNSTPLLSLGWDGQWVQPLNLYTSLIRTKTLTTRVYAHVSYYGTYLYLIQWEVKSNHLLHSQCFLLLQRLGLSSERAKTS